MIDLIYRWIYRRKLEKFKRRLVAELWLKPEDIECSYFDPNTRFLTIYTRGTVQLSDSEEAEG